MITNLRSRSHGSGTLPARTLGTTGFTRPPINPTRRHRGAGGPGGASPRCHRTALARIVWPAACLALLGLSRLADPAALEAQSGPLFPEPFEVEHFLVHDDGDGGRFVSEPVVDTYGGSWIVSRRPDGSRLIVDLARRELTEVRSEQGTYWTVSFDRFAELQRRLGAAQGLAVEAVGAAEAGRGAGGGAEGAAGGRPRAAGGAGGSVARDTGAALPEDLVVTEVPSGTGAARRDAAASTGPGGRPAVRVAERPGVRHLRVARRGEGSAAALEVWVDPSLRMGPAALAAVSSFETEVLSPPGEEGSAAAQPGLYLAAARRQAAGALPVHTVRPAGIGPRGEPVGRVEDVTTRLERLERFPRELAEIPEGLSRVPHPLEAVVRFLEEEAERDEVMSGRRRSASSGG